MANSNTWPGYFPVICPPKKAISQDKLVYRLVENLPATVPMKVKALIETTIEINPYTKKEDFTHLLLSIKKLNN
ncbi:hypothetical protein SAMN05660649_04976 [Desulfotomaculum arcticum]|uniref:Uncharacterized protein n=1 Tax=Desulfotruncus arcticus DSM 17038 TaxID=1121424 RepID=A0A1I2ZJV8_9FIRM|nr:hypothetical protein [Desulfotruncus arcticus]SFH38024.1 hypothetical protein SAMN05660649_04976 [Desulfotomaculum arcticum] [Desulfotruncus arcticus DSM 17038]